MKICQKQKKKKMSREASIITIVLRYATGSTWRGMARPDSWERTDACREIPSIQRDVG
jgi:hypothetical protein